MEKQGLIEKSASPWASNVVVVTKSVGTPRISLEYKMLNNVTYKDSYPLPNISDCLDAFKGSSWFGILDLRSSFYQIPLADADRDKTAFITRRGQWRFCSLPMGLSNSPATFQRLMDMVLRGLTWESVLVYIDDIVVYAHTYDEFVGVGVYDETPVGGSVLTVARSEPEVKTDEGQVVSTRDTIPWPPYIWGRGCHGP